MFEVCSLSINVPSLIILWENIGGWRNIKKFAIKPTTSLHVTPHQIFAAEAPTARKMINVLVLVGFIDATGFE